MFLSNKIIWFGLGFFLFSKPIAGSSREAYVDGSVSALWSCSQCSGLCTSPWVMCQSELRKGFLFFLSPLFYIGLLRVRTSHVVCVLPNTTACFFRYLAADKLLAGGELLVRIVFPFGKVGGSLEEGTLP